MSFSINKYTIDNNLAANIIQQHPDFLNWPMVYLLEDQLAREAYVGETTDVLTRLKTHAKTDAKQNLSLVNLILSELFHKSATLDIESNLIRYMAADGQYALKNGNLGISNHTYYQKKEVYSDLFKDIWNDLRSKGIVRHSLDYIDNSDLFKYSPYKSLSSEQITGLKTILTCLLDESAKVSLIQGGAGTGKSILAIFLFKLLKTDLRDFNYADFDEEDEELFSLLKMVKERYGDLHMALVIPMASFRQTLSNVFKNIQGLSPKMVIGPSEIVKQKYDLLIVDEGHRLRRRVNLGSYFGTFDKNCISLGLDKMEASELDWVKLQSHKSIIFYDQFQSIKPSDTTAESFQKLRELPSTRNERLNTQFRVKGGNQYVRLVHDVFEGHATSNQLIPKIGHYDVLLFDNLQDMVDQIKSKDQQIGLSRMVAGFAWEWISKNDKSLFDIQINDTKLQWNSTDKDWVNSSNASNEVGCIHTTQGYDLNYTGLIIGPELDYDFETQTFIVYKEKYKDKNGKNSIKDPQVLLQYIVNIYKTILLRGIEGTYIYACNPNLRKYLSQFMASYKPISTFRNSYALVDQENESTVPYYALEMDHFSFHKPVCRKFIEIPNLINKDEYIVCHISGNLLQEVIPAGRLALFKVYKGENCNGLITLIEDASAIDNVLIGEYVCRKLKPQDSAFAEEVVLRSLTIDHKQTLLFRDEEILDLSIKAVFVKLID